MHERRVAFAMKLQQYTGPVQAKGVEDTTFYRYNVLVSMNEVGGEPGSAPHTVADVHASNGTRQRDWPAEMTTLSTHDTKLGEDVRARINALSELADDWQDALGRALRASSSARSLLRGTWAPDRNDECRFLQVLLGCWPPGLPMRRPCAARSRCAPRGVHAQGHPRSEATHELDHAERTVRGSDQLVRA